MAKDLENIEIRSDKVRNIMGEEPPLVIRCGTIIISLILLISVVFTYLFIK